MKLALNDTLYKKREVYVKDLLPGQIFIDRDGDYCMRTLSEELSDGQTAIAIVLSGVCIGSNLICNRDEIAIPVKAELTVLGYD